MIDPYNELDHDRSPKMSETEFVSKMLTKIKRFAQKNKVHVWFVAHPRQMAVWYVFALEPFAKVGCLFAPGREIHQPFTTSRAVPISLTRLTQGSSSIGNYLT